MTALFGLFIFSVGGMAGLFAGCAFGVSSRFDLLEEIADLESEIDRLRAR
jgi:hypothetical protein